MYLLLVNDPPLGVFFFSRVNWWAKNKNRGEQAASAMEANLTNLEKKLDAMLAAFEAATKNVDGDDVTESGKKS